MHTPICADLGIEFPIFAFTHCRDVVVAVGPEVDDAHDRGDREHQPPGEEQPPLGSIVAGDHRPVHGGRCSTRRSPAVADTVPAMFDLASAAVEAALAAGARYADARVMVVRYEAMSAKNRSIEGLDQTETTGIGVRALIGSSWGFQSTPILTTVAARHAGERAAAVARASAQVAGPPLELAPAPVVEASWANEWAVHPLDDVGQRLDVALRHIEFGRDVQRPGTGDDDMRLERRRRAQMPERFKQAHAINGAARARDTDNDTLQCCSIRRPIVAVGSRIACTLCVASDVWRHGFLAPTRLCYRV